MSRRSLPALVGLLTGLLCAGNASAQDAKFNAQHARFDATGTGLAVVAGPDVLPAWRGGAGVLLHVADKPFALYTRLNGKRELTAVVQQSSVVLEVHGGFGFGGIADLGIVIPVAPVLVWGGGADGLPVPGGVDGAAMGDIALIPKVQFLNPKKTKYVGLGLQVPVSLPTGQGTRYLGDGGVNVALDILAEFRIWKLRVLGNISPIHVRPKFEYGDITRQFGMDWRAGLSFQVMDSLALRGEAWGTVSYVGDANKTTGEWSFSVSMTPGEIVQMEIGVGSGLGGFTTPGIRAFAGARFTIPGKADPAEAVEEAPAPVEAAPAPVEAAPAPVEEPVAPDAPAEVAPEVPAEAPAVEEAVEASQETATDAVEAAEETGAEAVEETAAEPVEAAEETAADAVEAAEETAADAVEAAEETADDAVEAVEETADEAVEETTDEAVEAAEEAAGDAAEAVEETADDAEKAPEEAVEDATEAVPPADAPE
ncbi:MAG: hypothetical protein KDA24_16800 [Deltaproteobacteria bacterium]|nr:hypothetical protein [Deltaproteobacteria bacterium]